MNKELEQLVEYAINDGVITAKEKKVLIKRALMQGFDIDELEMILEGKLGSINNDREDDNPVRKCPSCGEILTGYSNVCEACNYIVDLDSEDIMPITDIFQDIEKTLRHLSNFGESKGKYIFNDLFKILITGGLYIVYKVIKGEPLFVEEGDDFNDLLEDFDSRANFSILPYQRDAEIMKKIAAYKVKKDSIVRERRRSALIWGLIWLAITVSAMVLAIKFWPKFPDRKPTPSDMVEKYIKEKNIGKARAFLPGVERESKRSDFEYSIKELEMDSLLNEAKDYDAALRIVNLENSFSRDTKIDEIIDKEVKELIENKEFRKARERAKLASYLHQSSLESQIELAEKLDKKR